MDTDLHIPSSLTERLRNGDEHALRELLDLIGPKVLGYCKKKVTNAEDAEELVYDIFLKLWNFREKLDKQADIQILLFTIARNHTINFLRGKAVANLSVTGDEAALDGAVIPWQRLSYEELNAQYQQILARLGEKQRAVFILSREEGLSHKEIADKMGISIRTVEAHIYSSLKIIRTELKDAYVLLVLYYFW